MTWPPLKHLLTGIAALTLFALGASLALTPGSSGIAAAADGTLSSAQRAEVEALVRQYILDNPEIIPEAINVLQSREVARMIDSNREEIETPFEGAWAGAEDANVVLIEFFDYNCPYCREAHKDVARLLAEHDDLKIVYRDFPVLGPASREAAMASLSAARQDKYTRYYNAMFTDDRRVSRAKIIDLVRKAGLSETRTAADMNADALASEIDKNLDLGRALGLTGTPSYIVGDRILSGAVGYEALKEAIAAARERG